MAAPDARAGGAAAKRPRCFLDVTIGGRAAGRMVVELRADVAPRTVGNFVALWCVFFFFFSFLFVLLCVCSPRCPPPPISRQSVQSKQGSPVSHLSLNPH